MIFRFGQFELDDEALELRQAGTRIEVEPKALRLLLYLVSRPELAVSKDELQEALWPRTIVTEASLTSCVKKARRAVGDDAGRQSVIRTVHGHGYQFVAPLEDDSADTTPAAPDARESATHRPRWRLIAATAIVVIALVYSVANFENWTTMPPEGRIAVAVLPVTDQTSDDSLGWVRLGLMSLINRMLEDEGVAVVQEQSVMTAIGDRAIPRPLDEAFIERIGEIASARQVLDITLQYQNGLYRMSAVLAMLDGDRIRRVIVGDTPAAVAADMARVIGNIIIDEGEVPERRLRRVSSDPFINEAYGRGLDLELQGQLDEARTLFRLASEQEPELFWLRYEIALCTRDLNEDEAALAMFDGLLLEARSANDGGAEIATLNSLGVMHLNRRRYDQAGSIFEEAINVSNAGVSPADRAVVHINLALIATYRDDRPAAAAHYEEALSRFAEAEISPSPSFNNNYAGFLIESGQLEEAQRYSERAVAGFQLRGQRRYEASALNRLGKILRQRGQTDAALHRHEQALAIHRDLDNSLGETIVLMAITSVYRDKGDLTRARLNAIDVRERADATDNAALKGDAYMFLAQVEEELRDYETARREYVAARNEFATMGTPPGLRFADHGVARTTLRLGDHEQAMVLANDLLETARKRNDLRAVGRALQLIARIELATGQTDEAINRMHDALQDAVGRDDSLLVDSLWRDLAGAYLDLGLVDDATEALAAVTPGDDPELIRLNARLAHAQGETSRALALMTDLRGRIGESWHADDEALLISFSADPVR